MKRTFFALMTATVLAASPVWADDEIPPVIGGKTYTQHLVTTAKSHYPGVASIVVEGKRNGEGDVVVLGSTLGAKSVFSKVARPDEAIGGKIVSKHYVTRRAFSSNTGHRLGTIITTFNDASPSKAHDHTADAIAADLARVMLSGKNAVDPYPYDAKWTPNTYAQQLTEQIVANNPRLLVVMVHATPPSGGPNIVIGSNIGRFGKVADEDDLRIINTGATNLEVAGEGDDRYETALPLNDASGRQIGALGLVFHLKSPADKPMLEAQGRKIRDQLATRIPNNAALFQPRHP